MLTNSVTNEVRISNTFTPTQADHCVVGAQAFFKHSPHTNCISNSAILCNNYILLLSDLCACVHVKKLRHWVCFSS